MSSVLIGSIIAGAAGLVLLARRMEWGVYLLAATAFFSGWHLTLKGELFRAFFSLPIFTAFTTGPLVDFLALVVGAAFVLALVSGLQRIDHRQARALVPGLVLYAVFILLACISVWNVYNGHQFISFKYLVRPLLFMVGFLFVIPVLLIRTREMLLKVLWIWFSVGLVVVVYGLSSLYFASDDWLWVTPYPILGFAPMGDNHNQIAEALVAIIPFSAILYFINRKKYIAPYLLAGIGSLVLTALLTLSRALWLVFALQIAFVVYWYRIPLLKTVKEINRAWWYGAAVITIGLFVYMANYLLSAVPASSSNSRGIMTTIVLEAVTKAPLFGYGPGTHISLMQETPAYVAAFSEPLDAHGFMQKIILEHGVVGLMIWLAFLGWLLWYLYGALKVPSNKEQFMAARFFFLAAMGVVGFQLFNTSYYLATMWLPLAVCFAGASLIRHKTW